MNNATIGFTQSNYKKLAEKVTGNIRVYIKILYTIIHTYIFECFFFQNGWLVGVTECTRFSPVRYFTTKLPDATIN